MVAGYQDVDPTPQAGPLQLRNQQGDVVIDLVDREQTDPSKLFHRAEKHYSAIIFDAPH